MEIWPNLFIVGAPKAGTTSLHEYLKNIPGIYMSPVKEPSYFCQNMVPKDHYVKAIRDKKKYLRLFEKVKDEKIIGESSVWNLADPEAARLIHKVAPQARIIICIRDPVERAYSHYLMLTARNQFKTSSFHEQLQKEVSAAIDYRTPNIRLKAGLYHEDVKRYLDVFGSNRVKIIIFEEFIRDAKRIVQEVLQFLDIDYDLHDFKAENYNPFVVPRLPFVNKILDNVLIRKIRMNLLPESLQLYVRRRLFTKEVSKPKMLEEDRKFLQNFYLEDVLKLCNLIGRTLPWPNFKTEST